MPATTGTARRQEPRADGDASGSAGAHFPRTPNHWSYTSLPSANAFAEHDQVPGYGVDMNGAAYEPVLPPYNGPNSELRTASTMMSSSEREWTLRR